MKRIQFAVLGAVLGSAALAFATTTPAPRVDKQTAGCPECFPPPACYPDEPCPQ